MIHNKNIDPTKNQQRCPNPNKILRLCPLSEYLLYKEKGMLKIPIIVIPSKIPYTNENLFLLRSCAATIRENK